MVRPADSGAEQQRQDRIQVAAAAAAAARISWESEIGVSGGGEGTVSIRHVRFECKVQLQSCLQTCAAHDLK